MYANEPHSIIRLIIASSRPRVPLPSALSPARRLLPFLLLALFAAAVLFGAPATGPAFADGPPHVENTQNPLDTEEVAGTANWSGTLPDFAWTKGTAVSVTLPSYTGATSYEIRGPEHTNHIKALPAGLTFDASARTITGTPTEHFQGELYVWKANASAPQEENFRIRVADDDGNHPPERSFNSTVNTQIIPVNTSLHRSIYCNGGGTNDVLYVPGGSHSSFFVDPDGDTLTYTVSSSHPKVISVTTATHSGATVMKGSKRHPGTGTVTLTITGTDPDGLSEDVKFTVAGLTGCTEIHSINENSAAGTAVGTIGRGKDGGSSFSLTNGTGDTAATYFDINSTTGQITVKTGTTLDYETTTSYTGEVSYTVNNMTANADVTINVNNLTAPGVGAPTLAPNSTNPTTAIDVSWTAPTPPSGTTINDYDVQYRARGTSTWTEWNSTNTSTNTSATITGLTAGTEYEVQVRASVTGEGNGPWSGSSISLLVAENSAADANVGGKFTYTSPGACRFNMTLGGTDSSSFKGVNTVSGSYPTGAQDIYLRVKSGTSLDYENKTSYSTTLSISDGCTNDINGFTDNSVDYSYTAFIFVTDVNEPPGKPTVTVANNTTTPTTKLDVSWTAPTMTGKPAISDYDVQYRQTGDSSWTSHSFTGTGTTTTLSGLEAGKKYDVQVRAVNDEGNGAWSDTGNAITQSTAVTRSVAENTAAAGNVGAAVTMTAGSYTLAHTLSGTDASKFEIGATTGQITVKSGTTINYEKSDGTDHATAPSYSVTVSIAVTGTGNSNSVPNGTGTYTVPVTINVTDVNEPPPKMSAPTVTANSATPATKLDASWTAPTMTGKPAVDDYDVRYKKTGDSNWTEMYDQTDSTALSVTLDSLTSGKTYEVQVRAGNNEGDGDWSDSGTAITTAGGATRSVAENSAAGTNVGAAVTAKSTNTTYTYTHALSGTDASKFEIGSTTGQITVKSGTSLDYETTTSYSVIVTVTAAAKTQGANTQSVDPNAPGDYVVPVTINVTDVNEDPTFADDTATRSIAENSATDTAIGAVVTATDPDTNNTNFNTLTYSLTGTNASDFSIDSSTGQIKTKSALNHEAKTSYSVTVNVTDGKNGSGNADTTVDDTIAVTINVTDVLELPDAPTVTATANSTTPTSKIDASWTPPSMTGKPAIDGYDVRYKKSDESAWTMHKFSGVVTATRGSDGTTASVSWTEYDGSDFDYYRVIVCAADNFSTTGPTCSSAAFTGSAINSSSTTTQAVTGLTATTGYGVILQIWKDGNTSQKLYVQMAANQNDTTVRGTPTFNATSTNIGSLTAGKSYDVQARARNDEGTGAWSATASAITQVAGDGDVTRSVAENSAANANVGSPVTATSNTNNYTLTHSLSGTDAGKFEIASSTGQITVKSGTSLDYESGTTSYSVTVTVKAAAAGANAQSLTLDPNAPGDYVVPVTISVTDVNEPPVKMDAPSATQNTATPKTKLDVSWTALTTTQMAGKPAVSDYDVQYKKKSDSTWTSHSFTGTTTSTTLTGLSEGTDYQVQVRAVNDEGDGPWSDSGEANTQDKNVHAEFPNTSATRSVAENTAVGGNVGAAITATDTENHTLYYTLNGTDKDEFDIGLNTGQITVKTGKVPNYEAKTSYSLIVEVSDRKDKDDNADTKIDDTITVTINVTDVDEPPDAPVITVTNNADNPTKKIDVSWVAPDMTGKPAISNYAVQYQLSGANNWTNASFSGTETSTTLSSLTKGKSYDVQVQATNAEGDSPWSAIGTAITDADAVTRSVPENSVAGTEVGTPVTAKANSKYTYTHSLSGTDAGKFTIESSSGQIKVKSGTSLDYETKTSYGVIVTVKVKEEGASINSLDPNAPGNYIVPVTINVANENVPPAPAAPTVTATGDSSDTTLKVSWTAPEMSGYTKEEAITDYDVQYRKQGARSWTSHAFTGTGTTTTITGAVGGVNYNVQIRAVNREGNGRWSPSGDLGNADPKLPTSPSRNIAENTTGNVGTPITAIDPEDDTLYYTMTGTDADKFSITEEEGQISWADTDSMPDYEAKTSYSVTVSVSDKKDSEGNADTEIDDTVTVTINVTDVNEPPGSPGTPTSKNSTTTTITATWTEPDFDDRPPLLKYWVKYREKKKDSYENTWTVYGSNEVLLDEIPTATNPSTPLKPGTAYEVKVMAENDEGYGAWSKVGTLYTGSLYVSPTPTPPDDSNPPGGDPPKTTPPTNTPPGGNPPKTTPPTNTPPGGDPPKTTPPTQVPNPTVPPTVQPTVVPTVQPTLPPTRTPTGATPAPTVQSPGPTGSTQAPAPTPAPTIGPTAAPTPGPTAAAKPAPTAEAISVAVVVTPTPQPTPALLMTVGQLPQVFQPATATPQPTATPAPAPVEPTATPVAAGGPASGGPGLAPPAGAANIGDTGEREGSTVIQIIWPDDLLRRVVMLQTMVALAAFLIFVFYLRRRRQQQGRQSFRFIPGLRSFTRHYR